MVSKLCLHLSRLFLEAGGRRSPGPWAQLNCWAEAVLCGWGLGRPSAAWACRNGLGGTWSSGWSVGPSLAQWLVTRCWNRVCHGYCRGRGDAGRPVRPTAFWSSSRPGEARGVKEPRGMSVPLSPPHASEKQGPGGDGSGAEPTSPARPELLFGMGLSPGDPQLPLSPERQQGGSAHADDGRGIRQQPN